MMMMTKGNEKLHDFSFHITSNQLITDFNFPWKYFNEKNN